MAITVQTSTVKSGRSSQANFLVQATIDLDDSYPTGGYTVTELTDEIGSGHEILWLQAEPYTQGANYYCFEWDRANSKLKVRDLATGAEIAGTTDLVLVTGVVVTAFTQ